MDYNKIPNLRLEHIRIFCTVAKYSSITRAAEEFHYTQPMISRVINSMEQELEVILFIRAKNGMVLTPAGRFLYQRWNGMQTEIARDLFRAHEIQQNFRDTVVLGMPDYGFELAGIHDIVSEYSSRYPGLRVQMEYMYASMLLDQLDEGKLDLIFLPGSELPAESDAEYQIQKITNTGISVICRTEDAADYTSLSALRSAELASLSPQTYPHYYEWLERLCAKEGFLPRVGIFLTSVSSVPGNVWLRNGVAVLDSCYHFTEEGITALYVSVPESFSGIYAMWKADNEKEIISGMVDGLVKRYSDFV